MHCFILQKDTRIKYSIFAVIDLNEAVIEYVEIDLDIGDNQQSGLVED